MTSSDASEQSVYFHYLQFITKIFLNLMEKSKYKIWKTSLYQFINKRRCYCFIRHVFTNNFEGWCIHFHFWIIFQINLLNWSLFKKKIIWKIFKFFNIYSKVRKQNRKKLTFNSEKNSFLVYAQKKYSNFHHFA